MAGIKTILFVIGFALSLFPFVMAQEVVNNANGGNQGYPTSIFGKYLFGRRFVI